MIFNYDKTNGFNAKDYNEIIDYIRDCPNAEYRIEIKKIKNQRTLKQNATIHVIFEEIANQLEAIGFEITAPLSPTPVLIKEYFSQYYLGGEGTSDQTSERLAKEFDRFLRNINRILESKGLDQVQIKNQDYYNFLKTYQ